MQNILVCTDLDRTLIPNGQQPESPRARSFFSRLVSSETVMLAYVTGRHLALVEEAIAEYNLPTPDFTISDVGGSLYANADGQWIRSQAWDDCLAIDWQGKTAEDLAPLVTDIPGCRLQESEKQGLHKLSCYINLDAPIDDIIAQVKESFSAADIQANFIWSIDEQADIGLLDVLPRNANKYEAIAFLMALQNFLLSNTVFCGDSGNDRDVLISPISSVLVANANEELKQKVQTETAQLNQSDSLYVAKGNFLAMNGNYSAGIVEGVCHYFPEYKTLLS